MSSENNLDFAPIRKSHMKVDSDKIIQDIKKDHLQILRAQNVIIFKGNNEQSKRETNMSLLKNPLTNNEKDKEEDYSLFEFKRDLASHFKLQGKSIFKRDLQPSITLRSILNEIMDNIMKIVQENSLIAWQKYKRFYIVTLYAAIVEIGNYLVFEAISTLSKQEIQYNFITIKADSKDIARLDSFRDTLLSRLATQLFTVDAKSYKSIANQSFTTCSTLFREIQKLIKFSDFMENFQQNSYKPYKESVLLIIIDTYASPTHVEEMLNTLSLSLIDNKISFCLIPLVEAKYFIQIEEHEYQKVYTYQQSKSVYDYETEVYTYLQLKTGHENSFTVLWNILISRMIKLQHRPISIIHDIIVKHAGLRISSLECSLEISKIILNVSKISTISTLLGFDDIIECYE